MPGGIAYGQDVFLSGDLRMCPDTSLTLLIKNKCWTLDMLAVGWKYKVCTHTCCFHGKKTYVFTPALIAQDGFSKRQTNAVKRAVPTRHLAAGKRLFVSAAGDVARERTRLNKTPALHLSSTGNLPDTTWQFGLSYRKKPWWMLSFPSPIGTWLIFSLAAERKNSPCTEKWKGS